MLSRLLTGIEEISHLSPVLRCRARRQTSLSRSGHPLDLGIGFPSRCNLIFRAHASNLVNGLTENDITERVEERDIVTETEESYLAYAMSVLLGRSLPDVRDGLKPVHRRILYGMHELRMAHDKPHKKCARVVGEVLGKYHPHGDTAVYNAMVRMAQDFTMRYPLVDGHGNFGSLDHDPPAAMRYTECRLRALSSNMMLEHLEEQTVDFMDTFDSSEREPMVLPAKVPQLLINGCHGIAVGMATQIPPHNLKEVVLAMQSLIKNPQITITELMSFIPAPDFPTGGQILKTNGLEEAYTTGRGSLIMRGSAKIEQAVQNTSKKQSQDIIVISELPYNTNKAKFVQHIVQLVESQVIEGISNVSDESDRDGLRVVVEVKKGTLPEIVLNNLYKYTNLQTTFSCNMTAVVNGRPKQLNLKEFLQHFLDFRVDVIKRRSHYRLEKANSRLSIVEALLTAIENVEEVVKILREASSIVNARKAMSDRFQLNMDQSIAIVAMPLSRLTLAEHRKISRERKALCSDITHLEGILSSSKKIMKEIVTEANQIVSAHGDNRRSKLITDGNFILSDLDIIPNDPTIITFSKKGYIKRVDPDSFSVQRRGGKGVYGARMRDDDSMNDILQVYAHDKVLFFTSNGRVYCLSAYQIPQSSRQALGTPIANVLPVLQSASVTSIFVLDKDTLSNRQFLLMVTKKGTIKRTALNLFTKIKANGLIAVRLVEDDELRFVQGASEDASILIASNHGRVIRYNVSNIRSVGRVAAGVKGMSLKDDGEVVGMVVLPHGEESDDPDESDQEIIEEATILEESLGENTATSTLNGSLEVLMVTAKGSGKRTNIDDFPARKTRGGMGIIGARLRTGDKLVGLQLLLPDEATPELLLASKQGMMTRIRANSIRRCQRIAYGVRVMNMKEGDSITSVTKVMKEDS